MRAYALLFNATNNQTKKSANPPEPPMADAEWQKLTIDMLKFGGRMGASAVAVATVLFSFETITTLKQVDKWQEVKKLATSELRYFLKGGPNKPPTQMVSQLWKIYRVANKQSFVKGGLLNQHDAIQETVLNSFVGNAEANVIESVVTKRMTMISAAGACSFVDTACMNYYANMRLYHTLGVTVTLPTFADKVNFGLIASPWRLVRNFGNALAFVGKDVLLQPMVNYIVPADDYLYTKRAMTATIAGASSAVLFNPISVIVNCNLAKMDPNQLVLQGRKIIPNSFKTAKELYQSKGSLAFFRGAKMNVMCSSLAFFTLDCVDAYLDKIFGEETNLRKRKFI